MKVLLFPPTGPALGFEDVKLGATLIPDLQFTYFDQTTLRRTSVSTTLPYLITTPVEEPEAE